MTKLSQDPLIHPDCEIKNTTLGRYTEIGRGTHLLNVTMGDYSYCARYGDFANATIGRFSSIASFVRIGPTDHPMHLASMHHMLYRSSDYWEDAEDDADFFAARAARRLTIGHDTWIGHGAIIRPDVSIGHGAVVAAGAVVTKDVPPYTIVTGIPATARRQRFPDEIVTRLIDLAWWDWDHHRLRRALDDFRTLEAAAFLEKYGG
ncbi:MAG: chloramphenicol acetyltransferase [Pseudomonadota bacterium]